MLQQLIEREERFQPYLLNNDYTFIGPSNPDLLTRFIDRANNLAPVVAISRSIHHALSHKQATRQALGVLPSDTELRIYVVSRTAGEGFLVQGTIEDYCDRHNITFEE